MVLKVSDALQEFPKKPWYQNKKLVKLYLLTIPGIIFIHTSVGYDSSVAGSLQLLDTWQSAFNYPTGGILGLYTASYSIGSISSLPIAPIVSNKYGRRLVIFLGAIVTIIGVIVQTSSQNVAAFVVARIIIGFGDGFSMSAAPVLLSELAHATDRVFLNTLFSTFWNLGSVVASWLSFITTHKLSHSQWEWRSLVLIQSFWTLGSIITIWFIPESPRWQISKQKYEEARSFLFDYHAEGNYQDPIVQAEYEEIVAWVETEKEQNKGKSLWEILSTNSNKRRLIVLVSLGIFQQWTGASLVQTYLNSTLTTIGVTKSTTKTLISGVLSTWSWVVSVIATLNIERFGRRTLFLGGTIGLWLIFVSWTAASAIYVERHVKAAARAVIALIVLFVTVFNSTWNPLPFLHADEVMTFELRSKGASFYLAVQQAALIFNLFVNSIGITNIGWKYYIVYDVWLLVVIAIIYFFFVETRGYTLEEIGDVFDSLKTWHGQSTNDITDSSSDKEVVQVLTGKDEK